MVPDVDEDEDEHTQKVTYVATMEFSEREYVKWVRRIEKPIYRGLFAARGENSSATLHNKM